MPNEPTDEVITRVADALEAARIGRAPIAPVRDTFTPLDIASAYRVQRANTARALARGARIVGRKIGLTARAVQQQLGVDQPDYGALLDDMCFFDGDEIATSMLIQPKIEGEIAFVMGRDLVGERPAPHEVLRAVDCAVAALEIVDSRIARWDIGAVDTIADNASSACFVLGQTMRSPRELDLRLLGMALEKRGEALSFGAGAACFGSPLNAATWLARRMAHEGTPLRAGDVVLTGALGPMLEVAPGDDFELRVSGLGSVRIYFAPTSERGSS